MVMVMSEAETYIARGFVWVEEAVKKYGRSRAWIYPYVRDGKIRSEKYPGDRRLYINEADLVAIIGRRNRRATRKTSEDDA